MRSSVIELAVQSRELSFRLLRAIALSLNLPREFFVKCHDMFTPDCMTKLRSLYYPPINGPVEPGVVRCGEHSGTFTQILLTFIWNFIIPCNGWNG